MRKNRNRWFVLQGALGLKMAPLLVYLFSSIGLGQELQPTSTECRTWLTNSQSFTRLHNPYVAKKPVPIAVALFEFGKPSGTERVHDQVTHVYELDSCEGWVTQTAQGNFIGAGVRPFPAPPVLTKEELAAKEAKAKLLDEVIAAQIKNLEMLRKIQKEYAVAEQTLADENPDAPPSESEKVNESITAIKQRMVAPSRSISGSSSSSPRSTGSTYIGRRGGEYHYSRSGKKVYTKRK